MPLDQSTVSTDPSGIGDDELLRLAQQAGIVAPSADDGPVHQDPSSFAAQVGGSGPVTAPDAAQSAPPTSAPGLTTGQSRSSSVSSSGVNMKKMQANDAYIDPSIRKAAQGADAEANAMYAPGIQAVQDAHAQGVKAVGQETVAGSDLIRAQGREDRLMGDIYTQAAADEAKINEQYRGESNAAKADYMAALADFRSQRVDPQALWKSMGTGNQLGMLVSAFVQDFLGVKGIHVSAMDTFNKAVDRNIDAQIQNIKNKGEVTQGFKTLWEMQRQQAASDTEARARVRGFMLDGAKQAVVAHMAQYKAGLNDAQGQAALAKLDEEFSKNLIDVYKHIDTSSIQRREQAIQIFGDKLKAATEANRTASAERIAKMEHGPKADDPLSDLIISPETHRPIGVFRPDAQKDEKITLRKLLAGTGDVSKDFNELRDLARTAKSQPDGISGTRLADTDQQRFDTIAKSIGNKIARATDGRVSATEVQQFMVGVRPDTWLNQGETEKVIAQAQKTFLGSARELYQQLGMDLPADDPRRQIQFATQDPFGGTAAETGATINPPAPTHDEVMLKNAAKEADAAYVPGQGGVVDKPATNVKALVRDYADQHPANYAKTEFFGSEEDTPEKYRRKKGEEGVTVTTSEKGLVDLYEIAAKGGKTGEGARRRLEAEASEYLSARGSEDSSPESVFATYLLSKLHDQAPDSFEDPTSKSDRFKNP